MTTVGFPRVRVLVAIAVGLATGTVMAQLQAILARMHPPGGPAADVGGLWGVVPNRDQAREVIAAWTAYADGPGFRSAEFVLTWFVRVDMVFAVAYGVLLWSLLSWVRDALKPKVAKLEGQPVPDERQLALLRAYVRLAGWARALVVALVLADFAENLLTLLLYDVRNESGWFSLVYWTFWGASSLKWLLAALVVGPLLVGLWSLPAGDRRSARKVWRALAVARPQLLLLLAFAAAMFVSDQSADAFRRWRDDFWKDAVAGIGLTVLFSLVLLFTTRRLFHLLAQEREEPPRHRMLVLAAVLAAALGLIGWVFWGFFALAGILVAVAVLSQLTPSTVTPVHRRQEVGHAARWLPPVIAGAPLVLLGLGLLHAAVPEFAYSIRDWQQFAGLGALGIGLQVAGWGIAVAGAYLLPAKVDPEEDEPGWQTVFLAGVLVLSAYIGWRVVVNPWRSSEVLGTHGVFVAAMIAAAFAVFLLTVMAEGWRPPRIFVLLRLRRTPVFLLLLLWLVVAGTLDREGAFYDVRLKPATSEAQTLDRSTLTGRRAFTDWEGTLGPGASPVPMIFVGTAGGGIRAGYWAAVVLTCVLEGRVTSTCAGSSVRATPFAISAISGGSLGVAAYATHVRSDDDPAWFDQRLDDDYAAPVVGWSLFVDIPMSLVRPSGGTDRAEILERAWERSWVDDLSDRSTAELLLGTRAADTDDSVFANGIFDLRAKRERFPLLLLNGTKVQDGCRFNASVLELAVDGKDTGKNATDERLVEDCLALRLFEQDQPFYVPPRPAKPGDVNRDDWMLASTDDLSDFLCRDKDVRLSTAALLSARFPWVGPSGRIEKCGRDRVVNVVDGGYFDTSGASPIVELYAELEQQIEEHNARPGSRCIVPVYLQIDTGYSDPSRTGNARPWELTVPLDTAKSARNAREANARQAAALAFSGPIPGRKGVEARSDVDRFAHIYPRAHPGSTAPLGWTLSSTARAELKAQLARNTKEIEKVRGWLSDELTCPPAQSSRTP